MKKLYTLLFLVYGFIANAQIVNIPDANFKAKLLSASASNQVASTETPDYFYQLDWWGIPNNNYSIIDSNGDGEIQVSEAQAIKWLKIHNANILNLAGIEAFTNLQYLNCSSNSFSTNLNVSSLTNLKGLDSYNNQLSTINVFGLNSLQYLNCSNNQLTNIDLTGLNSIITLKYSNNQIPDLNLNGLNLYILHCAGNNITSLNILGLLNLYNLNCANNQLVSLDVSSLTNLNYLACAWNNISNLNVLNLTNLKELYCFSNQLSSLEVLNLVNLERLDCSGNQLTNIEVSSLVNLERLACSGNQLPNIDVSSLINLYYLDCTNNQITNLNLKNNNLIWDYYSTGTNGSALHFSNNPNLQYICADEEDVAMVQNKINTYGYASTCHVNSYCSFTPGGTFYTINGNNRFDGDANGCDSNDFGYPYLKFNVTDGTANGNFIANDTGAYFYDVHAGVHTMTPVLENPSYFNVSPTTVTIDFPTQASPFTQDFCITPNGVHHDLEVTVIPLGVARPGFDASYKVVYKNKGNQLENPNLTFAYNDNVMDFLNATVVATSQSTGLLTWNLGTLAPLHSGNFVVNFNLNSPMDTPPLNGGDFLNYTATINPTATDETPTDNVFTLNQEVVNSYDPNDKTCLEGETINPSMIGEYVHYQIRFENTGTYPAQNVVVKDMIDTTKFDIATLQMVSTSHSCYTRITGNKVEFIFENINLPFDDATNDGYVVFKIKTLPTLTINSTISNTAEIYFDYNFPIVTNTATSTYQVLANPNFEFANEFTLYPNPVKNVLNISTKSGLDIQSLEIYNTLGQLVIAKPNFEQTIDVSALKTGTYFVKVTTEKGSGSVKFIKE